jgi:hypothetical protein
MPWRGGSCGFKADPERDFGNIRRSVGSERGRAKDGSWGSAQMKGVGDRRRWSLDRGEGREEKECPARRVAEIGWVLPTGDWRSMERLGRCTLDGQEEV